MSKDDIAPDAFELVHSFVTASIEGDLTEDEIRDFEAMLQGDPQLQQMYVRYLEVTTQIPSELGDGLTTASETERSERSRSKMWEGVGRFVGNHVVGVVVVACLIGVAGALVGGSFFFKGRQLDDARPAAIGDVVPGANDSSTSDVGSRHVVAHLVNAHQCRWQPTSVAPNTNAALYPGQRLELGSGLIELAFAQGARVVVEGPATLTLVSDNAVRLDLGKLTADVPESALGFTVNTPWTRLVDLGTEFGVEVDSTGLGKAYVFRGEVALDPPESPAVAKIATAASPVDYSGDIRPWFATPSSVFLRENQSLSVRKPADDGAEVVSRGDIQPTEFVRRRQLIDRIEAARADAPPFQRWQAFRNELLRRGDIVAYYDFQRDDTAPNVLRDCSAKGPAYDGAILPGTEWTEGRFPGKQALRFVQAGSGVHVDFECELPQFTLLAWAKIERLSKVLNGLVMSDGEQSPNLFRWQIRRESRIFAYCDTDWGEFRPRAGLLDSEPLAPESLLQQWRLLGVVRDRNSGTQCFYLDGDLVGERGIFCQAPPARLGSVTIGGWDPMNFDDPDGNVDRALEGRMDEMVIFDSALSTESIRDIYKMMRPHGPDSQHDDALAIPRQK